MRNIQSASILGFEFLGQTQNLGKERKKNFCILFLLESHSHVDNDNTLVSTFPNHRYRSSYKNPLRLSSEQTTTKRDCREKSKKD